MTTGMNNLCLKRFDDTKGSFSSSTCHGLNAFSRRVVVLFLISIFRLFFLQRARWQKYCSFVQQALVKLKRRERWEGKVKGRVISTLKQQC